MKNRIIIAAIAGSLAMFAFARPAEPPPNPQDTLREVDGKKEGLEVKRYDNGAVRETINWKSGKRHGQFRSYHKNGRLASECEFADGLREGVLREYNSSGEIAWEKPYVHDKLHGVRKQWFNDSDETNNPQPIAAETHYEEGVAHGECVEYWSTGRVSKRGQHDHGEKEGTWTYYRQDGSLSSTVVFHQGKKVSESKAP